MKIATKAFLENKSLINYVRSDASEVSQGLYLDFVNSKAYLKNTITKYFISFPFTYEVTESEKLPKNFLIDSEKLLAVFANKEEIELKNDTFYYEKNEFKIRVNNQIEAIKNELPMEYSNSFLVSAKIMALLIKSTNVFYQDKVEDKFKTTYISDSCIFSINPFRGYLLKDSEIDSNIKFDFHTTFIDLLKSIDMKSCMIHYDEKQNVRMLTTESGLEVFSPVHRCPVASTGTKIFSFANNENKIIIERDKFLSTLNSLKPMYSSADLEKKVNVTFNDKEVIFEMKDPVNPYIKLVSEVISSSSNVTKIVDHDNFSRMLKMIDGEKIELKISDDFPVMIIKSLVENIFEIAILNIPKIATT